MRLPDRSLTMLSGTVLCCCCWRARELCAATDACSLVPLPEVARTRERRADLSPAAANRSRWRESLIVRLSAGRSRKYRQRPVQYLRVSGRGADRPEADVDAMAKLGATIAADTAGRLPATFVTTQRGSGGCTSKAMCCSEPESPRLRRGRAAAGSPACCCGRDREVVIDECPASTPRPWALARPARRSSPAACSASRSERPDYLASAAPSSSVTKISAMMLTCASNQWPPITRPSDNATDPCAWTVGTPWALTEMLPTIETTSAS